MHASNHLSIKICKTFFFPHCRAGGHTHTAERHTEWPHAGSDHSIQYSAEVAHMNLCQRPEDLSWARGGRLLEKIPFQKEW